MAAPGSHANKNSTQINKRRTTKQHSSSMYVGLLSTSALPFFFFSLLSLSEQVLKVTCFLVSGTKCPPERVQSQCNLVVWYIKSQIKAQVQRIYKADLDHVTFDLDSIAFILCDAEWEFLSVVCASTNKIFALGDAKWLQEGNMSSRKRIAV